MTNLMQRIPRKLAVVILAFLPALFLLRAASADELLSRQIYPLAKIEKLHTPKFELDLTEAPGDVQVQEWSSSAKALCEEWFPLICRFLATDDWTPPGAVRLVFKQEQAAPGSTSGDVIYISVKWIKAHPDDFGMVIHELTHVIQHYPPSQSQPGWLVEGVADYLRYWKYEPEKPHRRLNPAKASYRDGYGATAAFLAWTVWKYDKRIVRRLDDAMRHHRYNDAMFKETTGKDLDSLWAEFVQSQ